MDSLEEIVASGNMKFEKTSSLLEDIYAGKSAVYLRETYNVDVRQNWAIKNRAKNAAKVLENCDELTLRKLQGHQEQFSEKYSSDYLRRNRIADYQRVDNKIKTTTNYVRQRVQERDEFIKAYAARLIDKSPTITTARREELLEPKGTKLVRRIYSAVGLVATTMISLLGSQIVQPASYTVAGQNDIYQMSSVTVEEPSISINVPQGADIEQATDILIEKIAQETEPRQNILPSTQVVVLKENSRIIEENPTVRVLALSTSGSNPIITDKGACAYGVLEPVGANLEELLFRCEKPTRARTSNITSDLSPTQERG